MDVAVYCPDHVLVRVPFVRKLLCGCASIFGSLVTVEEREMDREWFIWTGLPRFLQVQHDPFCFPTIKKKIVPLCVKLIY
jgi:hypothetical protein